MDVKKFIQSRDTRFKILRMMSWVPDGLMVRLQYRMQMGFWPDLSHPRRYTEKLQVYKLKYRNPIMFQCADKYDVREYVKNKGLKGILNELYGVYDRAEDIDMDSLPNEFVAKTSDGMGGCNVKLVNDKNELDGNAFREELNGWLGMKFINAGREWSYTGIKKPRIIIEKLLRQTDLDGGKLIDFKYLCFDGEPKLLYVIDRSGEKAALGIFDTGFNPLPFKRVDAKQLDRDIVIPANHQEMADVARVLSKDFPYVRVDLYNIGGKIVFGELTFYDGSGYCAFDPDEYDFHVGSYFTYY